MSVERGLMWLLAAAMSSACAPAPDAGADTGGDTEAGGLKCALVVDGAHLAANAEAELLKGYQGYMLVQARAHFWGDVPRSLQIRLSGARDGHPPLVSVVGRRTPSPDVDGHLTTELLEIWLSPPNPEAFDGRSGTLGLEARDGARSCEAQVSVRYVDRTFCVHYDDGSVACPDED